MYYKIINKESQVYKDLYAQLEKEEYLDKKNKEIVDKLVDFKWKQFYGHTAKDSLYRNVQYVGFIPENEADVNRARWSRLKTNKDVFIPNRNTKPGRELYAALRALKYYRFNVIHELLKVQLETEKDEFAVPVVVSTNKGILLRLDDNLKPKDANVIQISDEEMNQLIAEQEALALDKQNEE